MADTSERDSSNLLAMLVKDGVQQLRLAGIGAVSLAQQRTGELIESLIREGERVQSGQRLPPPDSAAAAAETTSQPVSPTALAPQNLSGLEEIFTTRVARSLEKLQVPTQADLAELHRQMDLLNANIQTLIENPPE